MKKQLLIFIFFLMGMGMSLAQQTIYVNAGATGANNGTSWADAYTDFQTAINNASSDDAVWVAAGTYQPTNSGEYFSMKEGVKIYGGFDGTETLLSERDWINNVTTLKGNGTTVISNNYNGLTNAAVLDGFTITDGVGVGYPGIEGGGISNVSSSPTLSNLILTNNLGYRGGGISNRYCSPIITDVTISENYADSEGGGICNMDGSPILTNVIISGNTAYSIGGGVSNVNASPTLTNVTISGNTANNDGGGIYNMSMGMGMESSPTLTNVTISGNSANYGGGISNESSSPTLTNVTISGNTANNDGGGIYNMSMGMGSSLTLYNSIVLGNNSGIAGDPIDGSSSKNLIQTGDENSEGAFDGITIPGATASAIFVDPQAPAQTTAGDYSLKMGAYAIDKGDNTFNSEPTDLAGNSRINGTIDLGAYEYYIPCPSTHIMYVDINALGTNIGESWTDAFTDLQTALIQAQQCPNVDEVWVAQGTYQPANTGNIYADFFTMVEGVKIYGGFDGIETLLSERDWINNVTTLKGNGTTVISNNYNGLTNAAVLDGFTITDGVGVGYPGIEGGGISNVSSSPTLSNLILTNNLGYRGGGISNRYCSPIITDVTISENYADSEGGGIYNMDGSPILTNVIISGNTAYSIGGGVSNVNASPILTNVIISGNSANYGGGISNMDMGMSDPQILTNVTISGNTANNDGGGIYNMSMGMGSSLTLYNSIVLGNNSGIAGDPIDGSSSKNLIQTGDENSEGAFDGITIPGATASAIFVDPQAPAQTTDGDYSLLCFPDNPAINSGDDTYNTESLDLAGNNRKVGIIDLGAYELQGISNDASLTECEDIIGSSSGTFDLINAEADISTTTGLTFTYYSDATYTTAINDPTSFTANNGDIVYVTVNDGACFDYAEITLNTKSQSAGTDIITACDSYTWIDGNEYTTSNNTATYTLTNAAGCDSIVTLDLTIIVIDKTINELNDELSATQNGATYQWIDCDDNDAPIVGATSQSFEPTQDGNYAVIITLGSCSEQSDCYPFSTLGVNTEFTDKWNVYPNPVNDQLFIESTQDIVIYIYDITGKIMNVSTLKSGLESIDVSNFAKGVYVIKSDKGAVSKFVKK